MPCYHPLTAYRTKAGVFFSELKRNGDAQTIQLPCGRCVGCRLEYSRKWAIRCMHEARMHDSNCFITLTYSSEFLPSDMSLNYDHFQKFMKRLRKKFGNGVRFYMCGEYGEQFGRPHYHACIFGMDFPDRVYRGLTKSGLPEYESKILEKLWPFGRVSVGDLTFESAAYCARYIMKKITGDMAVSHYRYVDDDGVVHQRVPEFCQMSRGGRAGKGGLGTGWIRKYMDSVYPFDEVIVRQRSSKPPRFYDLSFTEHGYIIGLACVDADLTYQQGMRRMWSRESRYDFYWPVFSALGEQSVLMKEIYCTGDPAVDDLVWGYQEHWAEYRYFPSMITSLFKSTSAGTVDAWHLAQKFTSQPTLNAQFIQSAPPVERITAVGAAANGQQLLCDMFFDIRSVRPMPLYSVPGLVDHF